MRRHGTADSAKGLIPEGHLCWAYDDRAQFRARAVEYVVDGIAAGQWVEFVGSDSTGTLHAELAGFEELQRGRDAGGIAVTPVEDFYAFHPGSDVVDPHAAVAARVAAAEEALAAGYTGFRAVVDATAMVATSQQRRAFVQFEHLIDRTMRSQPVTAMCCFDLGHLGSAAVTELACLHPLTNHDTPFQLYAEHDSDIALTGTVDRSCADLFTTALAHATAPVSGKELVIDGRGLTIDDYGLFALDRLARDHDRKVILRGSSPRTIQLIEQLDLTHIKTEHS